ncbi:MAG: hypothetical protein ACYTG3_18845 [Planctomycetota bacterium]|jgi:hypothetical protein
MDWLWVLLALPALQLVAIPIWAARRGHSAWEFSLLTVFCLVLWLPFGTGLLLYFTPFNSLVSWWAWLLLGLPAAAALLTPAALLYLIRPPNHRT